MQDEPERKVLEQIHPEEVIELAAQLIRINSVWDPSAGTSEQPAAELVARWAVKEGFLVHFYEVAPARPNVLLSGIGKAGKYKLLFEGHTDVVTPGDLSAWSYDPFGAQVVGRRMYGRGSNDTKGNLAAMLVAMAALKRAGVVLKGSVLGGVLCDEEGQMIGVLDFIEKGHADGLTGAVICEPQDGWICTSQKGAIRARYRVEGRMSHGAMPLEGLNPAPAVAELIHGLHRLERKAFETFGRDPLLGWPSLTPTVIRAPAEGSAQLNVVPREAEILVDARTIPGQSHPELKEALSRLAAETEKEVSKGYEEQDRLLGLDRDRGLRVSVDFLTDRPCTHTDPQDPLVLAADRATRRISGREPFYGGVLGATDGTFLWAKKGIPIVTMGAGDRLLPHQVDEWVDLDQLVETAKIYALTALYYLGAERAE